LNGITYAAGCRESSVGDEDLCCGLTREHIEAILFWLVTCCNRGDKPKVILLLVYLRKGDNPTQYLKYKPLRGDDDTEEKLAGETLKSDEKKCEE
jgi:hypothetical protein